MKTFLPHDLMLSAATEKKRKLSYSASFIRRWKSRSFTLFCSIFILSASAFADYTVASGSTIDATTITGQSGILTINGTLNVSSNVTLANFTAVIINGPNGQIYWTNNSDLIFSAGTTFNVYGGAPGLQPTNGNASKRLIVGSITIAVSNSNSNNASFSFAQFNGIGGLPQFSITSNSPVCSGTAISLTGTPSKTSSFVFKYVWSCTSGTFSQNNQTSTTSSSTNLSIATPGTYTVNLNIVSSDDGDLIATTSTSVTVNGMSTLTRTSAAATTTQSLCINTGITPITYSVGGTGTGASVTGLPTGVIGSYNAGVYSITGTPTVGGTYNYTVTTTGGSCPVSLGGTITVNQPTVSLTSAGATTSQTPCRNTAITSITYSISGTATGAGVTGLPTGVTGSFAAGVFTISGTPTVAGTYNYTVTTSGGTCGTATASGSITVGQPSVTLTSTGSTSTQTPCANTAITPITYSIGGTAGGASVTGLPSGVTGSYAAGVYTISGTPTVAGVYNYTVTTTGGACAAVNATGTITVNAIGTWLGYTNDWYDAANWCGGVPTTITDAILPAGLSKYPIVTTGTAEVHNITLASTSAVTFSNKAKLRISGTVSNSGTFDAQGGVIELNGSGSAQSISGGWFVNRSIRGLIVSNASGVNVSSAANDTLSLTDHLAFGNVNNATLNTGDNIALKSTASGTARVADITNNGANSGNSISGKVILERYLPMSNSSVSRRWRLLTTPIQSTGAPSINASWQEGASNSNVNSPVNPRPGYGTQITNGNTAAAVANGFDIGSTASPSIYYMSPGATPTWVAPNSTLTGSITDREGYMIFVRGDRSILISNQYVAAKPATLAVKGKLNTGNVTKPLVTGKQVIGNPYASAISFDNIIFNDSTPNIAGRSFYYWDPKTSGSYNVGRFITVSNDGVGSPSSYTVTANVSGLDDGTIESGAAFVVISDGGSNSITFHETDKIDTSRVLGIASRPIANRPTGIAELSKLYTNLYALDNGSTILADGVVSTYYPAYSNAVTTEDAPKLISFNSKETVSILRDASLLSIEKRETIINTDTTFLQIRNMDTKTYAFEFVAQNFGSSLDAYLEDKFFQTLTPLTLGKNDTTLYVFQIDNNSLESKNPDRFKIVYKPSLVILPVKFKAVKAFELNKGIAVEWSMENESEIKQYEVERSADGVHFNKISTYTAINNTVANNYSHLDNAPLNGVNFYRIRSISKNGAVLYSSVVKVQTGKIESSITVSPSLITHNSDVVIRLTNVTNGKYQVRVMNTVGQIMYDKSLSYTGGTYNHSVTFDSNYSKGTYLVEIINPANKRTNLKIIKQ
ncbi:hypothetical protein ACQ33O_10900 [Ferruginibacter sp. SUN002]|uniref:hypothetical protein n=1 Tax=Ferruginibacter sp. SUN002 TaxID=2937789 RepID=UPI003D363D94